MIREFIEVLFSLTNLIFFSAILGWFLLLKRRTKKIGRLFILVALICFYFSSTAPGSDLMIKPLENQYSLCETNTSQSDNKDDIVLLSGGLRSNSLPLDSSLGDSTLYRVTKTIEIYRDHPHKIILSGVRGAMNKIKSFLINLGVSEKDIVIDGQSYNTYQNALATKKIVGNNDFILVTSAFHMPRAMLIFEKLGMHPKPCPTDFREENNYTLLSFLPRSKNLKKSNLAFHEYLGILFYKLYAHQSKGIS